MKFNKRTFTLLIIDLITAELAWILFVAYRKIFIEHAAITFNKPFYEGIVIIPIFWVTLYSLQGTYIDVKRIYRIQIVRFTITASILGTLCLFFTLLLDDSIPNYESYYKLFIALGLLHFCLTIIPRYFIIYHQVKRIHQGIDGFKTILIGNEEIAKQLYDEIINLQKSIGTQFVGYVETSSSNESFIACNLQKLGTLDDLKNIFQNKTIEEVIIATNSLDRHELSRLLSHISGKGIKIKLVPDIYDLVSGSLKIDNLFGALLLEIPSDELQLWQKSIKRAIDIVVAMCSIISLLPLYILIAIGVKRSSKGPIFFLQERIGKNGKPFKIIKFRSMYINAENNGPLLSSSNDQRITSFGKFLRKTRLDEFPQFFNVLIGDMSLVGPRPERQFFIDQIIEKEPHFLQLTSVRPGITSWGQVKYGYAENVPQMIQRMKYDLLYLKNRSLGLDFKIMFYTIITILKAKGK